MRADAEVFFCLSGIESVEKTACVQKKKEKKETTVVQQLPRSPPFCLYFYQERRWCHLLLLLSGFSPEGHVVLMRNYEVAVLL